MPKQTLQFAVDQPCPLPVPTTDGPTLEMTREGELVMFVQLPGATKKEIKAFRDHIKGHGCLVQTVLGVPLILWAFKFQAPLRVMDMAFDSRLYAHDGPELYLHSEANALFILLVDGQIVKGIKTLGLDWRHVEAFKGGLRQQQAALYTPQEFYQALAAWNEHHTPEDNYAATRKS